MPPKRKGSDASHSAKKAKGKCPFDHSKYREGRAENDGPSKCTWFPGTTAASPHTQESRFQPPKILSNILEHIGNTPLVRLNKIPAQEGVPEGVEILAKCEFFNAGGSVKDRIAKRMIEDAEATGRIKPGDTLIEPTSGNTGIGLALGAAVKGYNMVITLPEKMSAEKVDVLKAFGAEIHRTPNEAAWDAPESHIGVAKRIESELERGVILDQYKNPGNPLAHYDQTAEELLHQCDGKIDMAVVGTGTGGTMTGIARKLKERCPDVKIVAVDPIGSILAEPDSLNDFNRLVGYQVEGTGYDFIPTVLDRSLPDYWIKTADHDSLIMSRRLIRHEGLLCGGSSGANVWAACQAAKEHLKPGQRCVVILPDSTRNYMTKFLNDNWMREHGHVDGTIITATPALKTWWSEKNVADLRLSTPVTVTPTVTCKQAVGILKEQGFDVLPVCEAGGELRGVITDGSLTAKLASGRVNPSDPVQKAMFSTFRKVTHETTLGELSHAFESHHFAVCISEQRTYSGGDGGGQFTTTKHVSGVVTRIDLLSFINSRASASATE